MEFKLPDLGEGIHEAQIISVLVKEGDTVAEDQSLMEVETDKAAVEIPAPQAGTISKLHVKAGQTVNVGDVLVTFGGNGAAAPAKPAKAEAPAPAKKEAPAVARSGGGNDKSSAPPARMAATTTAPAPSADASRPVAASPSVRRMAREMGIDLHAVRGTGPGGRVIESDLASHGGGGGATAAPARAAAPSAPSRPDVASLTEMPQVDQSLPDFSKWGPVRREAVPQIRKTIARQMTRAWLSVPRVTHSDNADVTDVDNMRRELSASLEKQGGPKVTLTGILIKSLGVALRKYPMLNASFDANTNEIIYKDYVHMGIAVDTDRGLVVPVVRDVDQKNLVEISNDLADVGQRAREAKFGIEELRGGTFTVTNVGALGGAFVTPMVNFPESAILGVGRAGWQPAIYKDEIAKRMIMPLSLSFDHRIIDGADAARFTKEVIGYLENPLRLLTAI